MKVIRHKIKLFNSNFPKRESHFLVQRERERERERERASLSLLEHSKDVRWDREKEREVENWNTLRGGAAAARWALKAKPRQSLIWSRCRRCQCALGLGTGRGGAGFVAVAWGPRNLFLLSPIQSRHCRWPDVLCCCCCCWVWGGGVDVPDVVDEVFFL